MLISEQEKNRILNLHRTSKNVNGVLVTEQRNADTAFYAVQVEQASKLDWGSDEAEKKNVWWKASNPHKRTQEAINQWNTDWPSLKEYQIKMSKNTNETYTFKWYAGPFKKYSEAKDVAGKLRNFKHSNGAIYFSDAFVYQQCGWGGGMSERVKVGTKCGEVKGDVTTETDVEFPNITFSDSLNPNKMPTFDPTKESEIYECTMKGCSAWVSDTLNKWQGNAWHAHRLGHNKYSAYESNLGAWKNQKNIIEGEFSDINATGGNYKKGNLKLISNLNRYVVPNQNKFQNLELDDIVGLYYRPSQKHSMAFFEGMTGYNEMGKGSKAGDGPFMVKPDGTPWSPEDLGKKIDFKFGNTLNGGKGPGINTHLGFVGAINNGEPIIFHNIDKQVYATPLSKMNKDKTAIVWAKGDEKSGTSQSTKSKTEKVADAGTGAFNWLYNKYFK